MNRNLAVLALLTVAATAGSFSVARWMASSRQDFTAGPVHDPGWLRAELKLTEAQWNKVRQESAEFQNVFSRLCAEHCEARFELGEELAKPKPDAKAAREAVLRMNQAQANAELATFDHIMKVRSVLSDEQALRYGELVRDQVCSMIPKGAPVR